MISTHELELEAINEVLRHKCDQLYHENAKLEGKNAALSAALATTEEQFQAAIGVAQTALDELKAMSFQAGCTRKGAENQRLCPKQ